MKLHLILFTMFFVGCHISRQHWIVDTQTEISPDTKPIVDSLAKYKRVDNSYIGFVGDKSIIYKTFENLCSTATDGDLIRLTAHSSPSVRVYAFWALSKRKSKELFNIIHLHRKDRSKFAFWSGCDGGVEQVNTFLLNLVTPGLIDAQTGKLSWSEIEKLKKEIRR